LETELSTVGLERHDKISSKLRHSSLRKISNKWRALWPQGFGKQAAHARQPLPAIPGVNLAGVVESIGTGVTEFHRDDEVYGMTGGVGGLQDSLAEFVAADADLLARRRPRHCGCGR
jgi:NADPH:quinone reductase-like Zn-dependent oxidoreductase